MLYAFLRQLARLALAVFYRKIEVRGREQVPAAGPVVFVSNHANALVDPLVVISVHTRRCSFLAKAPLFDIPVYGALLRSAGALPAYRQQDGADTSQNQKTFEACYDLLARGGAIALFPEGRSHSEPQMSKIKTGAARIVLEAEARHGFSLGTKIVPVGLNWDRKQAFRSRVLVMIGAPLDPSAAFETYRSDPFAAAHSLTAEIRAALESVTVQAESREDLELLKTVQTLWSGSEAAGGTDPVRRGFDTLQRFLAAYPRVKAAAPERIAALRVAVRAYADRLGFLGIDDRDVTLTCRPGAALRYLLRNLATLFLGFPFAAIGLLHSLPPYVFCRYAARKFDDDPDQPASAGIYGGLIAYPIFFGALVGFTAWRFGVEWGLAYAALLAGTSWIALGIIDRTEEFLDAVRTFLFFLTHRGLKGALRRRREAIREEVAALVEQYREKVAP